MLLTGNSSGELISFKLNMSNEKNNFTLKNLYSLKRFSIDQLSITKREEIFFGSKNGTFGILTKNKNRIVKNKDVGDRKLNAYHMLKNGNIIAFYDNYIRTWKRYKDFCFFSVNKLICEKQFDYTFMDKTERFFLSTSFFDNKIYVWNLVKNKLILSGKTELKEFIISLKGISENLFSIGTHTGSIYIYSIYGELIKSFKKKNSKINFLKPDLHKTAAWLNSNILFSGKLSGRIEIFDIRCDTNISSINGHSCEISNLEISTSNLYLSPFILASSDVSGNLKLWDIRNKKEVFFHKKFSSKITSFCFF